ncbi:MAG TPA: FHA domain-containing protein, partial [Polyangiaceae bacterium]|nr:FHA domain-containing protein [Polyangiaceae bacterium]
MAEAGLRVIITQDERVEHDVTVHGSQVLIGSGGHCDVRLGPDLLAPEQIRLSCEERQVWVTTLARSPAVLLDGRPFSSGAVGANDALGVGRLVIRVVAWQEEVVTSSGHKRWIPLVLLLTALSALAVVGGLSRKVAARSALPEPPGSPFADDSTAPSCPEVTTAAADVAGGDLWR